MAILDKLVGLAGMESMVASTAILKQFLSGIVVVIALTAVSSTLAGILMMAGLYAFYLGLIRHGLDPTVAALLAVGIAVIVMAGLGIWAMIRWRELKDMPGRLYGEVSLLGRVDRMADAFIDGLLERVSRN